MTHSLPIVTPVLSAPAVGALDRAKGEPSLRGVADLTRAMAAGDEDAFREFHRRYFGRLFRFALVVARGDPVAAGDAMGDALCRVSRHVRGFDSEEVFWCWLVAVVRSAARDAGRKRRRYVDLLADYARRWLVLQSASEAEADRRLEALAAECLGELDPADRALVEGKYLEGRSVRELAERAHATEKAVESRLGRLRHQLRARLLGRLKEDER
ncbi:MAG TPA: sigma-70 family RNA polymerase sigma factor [Verrucomicrobiota bacterium]|nr:sigma-70 family RNA polymerase sigma factor [Verrucomicrobiota bacterium]